MTYQGKVTFADARRAYARAFEVCDVAAIQAAEALAWELYCAAPLPASGIRPSFTEWMGNN